MTPAVLAGADLSATKTDNHLGGSIVAGGTLRDTLTARNDGPDATAAIRVIDHLPPETDFQYQSAGGTSWSFSRIGTTVTCTYTGPATVGALPPVTITGRVIRQSSGTITNTGFIELTSPLFIDPRAGNNTAPPVVTQVTEGSDLRAGKSFAQTTIVEGASTTATLTAFNDGPLVVTGATITDTFASNFAIGTLPAGCTRSGQTVTCNAGKLTSGQSRAFVIPLTALTATAGVQTNTATVAGPPGLSEPDLVNNMATATSRIVPPTADLSITKSKTPNRVQAGRLMTSIIVVRNNGPAVLTFGPSAPLCVTDTVSADETYKSAGRGWTCGRTGFEIVCDRDGSGTLAVNATVTLTLVTRAGPSANANLPTTACTGTTGGSGATPVDTHPANDGSNTSVRATTVTTDLAVVKDVSLNPAGPLVADAGAGDPGHDAELRHPPDRIEPGRGAGRDGGRQRRAAQPAERRQVRDRRRAGKRDRGLGFLHGVERHHQLDVCQPRAGGAASRPSRG